jgi:hemerythrin superfamily protein
MTTMTEPKQAEKTATGTAHDAIAMLTADHKKVKKLFKEFDAIAEGKANAAKASLAKEICMELTVHATLEEEIFYPAVRKAISDNPLMNEAEVEHAGAKDLIAQIESMEASEPMFAAKVTVLGEYIDHHVKEEENEMFAKARKTKLDFAALGERMLARKEELLAAEKTKPSIATKK